MTDREAFEAHLKESEFMREFATYSWAIWQAAIEHERAECAKLNVTADELEAIESAIYTLDDRGEYWEATRLRELLARLPPPPVDDDPTSTRP
jgi:hypothetical protein